MRPPPSHPFANPPAYGDPYRRAPFNSFVLGPVNYRQPSYPKYGPENLPGFSWLHPEQSAKEVVPSFLY
ncbi:hypothetical protein Ciccas_011605 [Cichlidogyrus casuarinus]|uniref:Uncharacterized protein n=1 Tax=Cichlidogyrus casuarinus TaxID=1844966 RepID=A0ABD2PS30_9PLAT